MMLGFVGLCMLLELAPGPDTFLVLRYSLRGPRGGIAAAVGSAMGSLVWTGAVAAGLATLLEESATTYRLVKIAGGLYLLYLGTSALIRRKNAASAGMDQSPPPIAAWSALRAGLFSCVLNPKVGLFFLAVIPQFLPTQHVTFTGIVTLGLIETLTALLYLVSLAFAASRAMVWLRRPRITQALDRVSAAVLAAFGIGTLASAAS
jgi:threonine/homoserine/homoserine lactone efflux protein